MSPLESNDLAAVTARFGLLLRAAGVPVPPERAGRLAAAVAIAAPATVDELYWLARVTLLGARSQIGAFDAVFAQVFGGMGDPAEWRGEPPPPARPPPEPSDRQPARRQESRAGNASPPPLGPAGAGESPPAGDDEARSSALLATASTEERLKSKAFDRLDADELRLLADLMGRLSLAPPPRPSRRDARSPSGAAVDLRATLRRARRTGGDPVHRVRRRRRTRTRRLVLLCDISGSMEGYARAYLQLLVCAAGGPKAEVFVFATRLTRLTRVLRNVSPDAALERAGRAAPDWSGGTRIGEALKAFNDRHGRRGTARGAVVVILSDGWERGDPDLLARELGRLGRLAHRLIWVNPRSARERYEPLTGGMAAALPHVDAFLSGHSLHALTDLVDAIAGRRPDAIAGRRPGASPTGRR
ncbi:MAG TPA: VWA domain-containing protein [Acidimicrobiales bacterium]|nr:VWA domain-containing protein [Acidimicrobiales bacterium]